MGIQYIQGDLFTTKREVIAHGVNCYGAFGAGIAKIMSQKYPVVKQSYTKKCFEKLWYPGDVQFVKVNSWCPMWVANLATQKDYKRPQDTGDFVVYNALYSCFIQLFEFCENSNFGVAMPMIGSGLAGGDWKRIESILKECLRHRPVEVDIYQYAETATRE